MNVQVIVTDKSENTSEIEVQATIGICDGKVTLHLPEDDMGESASVSFKMTDLIGHIAKATSGVSYIG